MFRRLVTNLGGLVVVAVFLTVLAGPSLGGDARTAHAKIETPQCRDIPIGACIALDPQTDTNTVGDTHTITATVSLVDVNNVPVDPFADIALYIFVIKGPNAGERVLGTTDANGQVALTYTGAGGVGTDMFGTEACPTAVFCLGADSFIDSCVADPDPCVDTFFNSPTCDGSPGDGFLCDNATKDWVEAQAAPTPTPEPDATVFAGEIEVVDDNCGGGTITLTVNPEGTGISAISVIDFVVSGTPSTQDLVFDPPIAIASDGSFSNTGPLPPPLDTIDATIVGVFDFGADPATVSGTATILVAGTPLCEAAFTAEALAAGAEPPTPVPTVAAVPEALPVTGATATPGTGGGVLWAAIAGIVAVFALGAAGAVTVRRRST